ncbi:hypothetical protein PR048_016803 [Dryococelus australis]|uniref:C2H2-type domain-containing protein n=1 Tax=Dryococelus australis TaxID=614101 RepID=A0ABQ9H7P8_9NEOP|nr:hypothetical protein PR048_016803 [Dryococelus australis]
MNIQLRLRVGEDYATWVKHTPDTCFCLRSRTNGAMGKSSTELLYGGSFACLGQFVCHAPDWNLEATDSEWMPENLLPGEYVNVCAHHLSLAEQNFFEVLTPKWTGPHKILDRISATPGQKRCNVHRNDICSASNPSDVDNPRLPDNQEDINTTRNTDPTILNVIVPINTTAMLTWMSDGTVCDRADHSVLSVMSHDQHTRTNSITTCIALHEKYRTCSVSSFLARCALHPNLCKKFSCKVGISCKFDTRLALCELTFLPSNNHVVLNTDALSAIGGDLGAGPGDEKGNVPALGLELDLGDLGGDVLVPPSSPNHAQPEHGERIVRKRVQVVKTDAQERAGHVLRLPQSQDDMVGDENGITFDITKIVVPPPRLRPRKIDRDIEPPVGKGPYKCPMCIQVFVKWAQLRRHVKSHKEDKPFICRLCPASFNVEANLVLHEATHDRENPRCPECHRKFSRIASLKAHIIVHEREESLFCPACGDEFATQIAIMATGGAGMVSRWRTAAYSRGLSSLNSLGRDLSLQKDIDAALALFTLF